MDERTPRRPRKGIAAAGLLLGFLLVAPASALADADLALDFHGTQQTWYPGGSLYYQAIVSSAGPSSTTAAVTVNLPAAATAFNPANAPCSGSTTVTCDLGEIDPGSGALIGIYVDAPAPGRYAASAHVAGADPDPDDTNNGRTVTSDVIETRPSVGIRSVSGPTTVTVGGKATYRIDVHNYGPGSSPTMLSLGITGIAARFDMPTPCQGPTPTTCGIDSIRSGRGSTIIWSVRPRTPGPFTLTAATTSPFGDLNPADNHYVVTGVAVPATVQLSRLTMTRARFAVAAGAASTRTAPPRGSAFRFKLSDRAAIHVLVERVVTGRRVGRTCRPDRTSLGAKPHCQRFLKVGTVVRAARAGLVTLPFSGKVGRLSLRPARYRATLTATGSNGKPSSPRSTRFRIVPG